MPRILSDTLEKLVAFRIRLAVCGRGREGRARAVLFAVERAATTEELARFDVHAPAVRVCIVSSCVASASTFPPPAPSALYADRSGGGRALCPLERRAGVSWVLDAARGPAGDMGDRASRSGRGRAAVRSSWWDDAVT